MFKLQNALKLKGFVKSKGLYYANCTSTPSAAVRARPLILRSSVYRYLRNEQVIVLCCSLRPVSVNFLPLVNLADKQTPVQICICKKQTSAAAPSVRLLPRQRRFSNLNHCIDGGAMIPVLYNMMRIAQIFGEGGGFINRKISVRRD